MKRCEYNNCGKPAYKKLLDLIWVCKKHYLIILDTLKPLGAGRHRKISLEKIFRWLDNGHSTITIKDFMQEFLVTYPTASFYIKILEKYGFLEKKGSMWWVNEEEL